MERIELPSGGTVRSRIVRPLRTVRIAIDEH